MSCPGNETARRVEELEDALRDCVRALNAAFAADIGDVFGVHHNDATDTLFNAERLLKEKP